MKIKLLGHSVVRVQVSLMTARPTVVNKGLILWELHIILGQLTVPAKDVNENKFINRVVDYLILQFSVDQSGDL